MDKSKPKRIVVVLGMHRSGTSAITRGLRALGVSLGEDLLPPLAGNNPTGFWEDADINGLNIEILSSLGSDWHFLAPLPDNSLEKLRHEGLFLRAVMLLREKVKDASVFGFKDPRVPMLLSFWQEVFTACDLDAAYVLVLRNPISVAQSLAKRDGFGAAKSHLLWLRSVLDSLSVASHDASVVVDYDFLMQSPSAEMHRIARALKLDIDQTELDTYIDTFLDKSLRHTAFAPGDILLDGGVPPIVAEIYATLSASAKGDHALNTPQVQKNMRRWTDVYRQMYASLSLVDGLFVENLRITRDLCTRDQENIRLSQQLAARDGALSELGATVQALLVDRNAHKENGEKLHDAYAALKKDRDGVVSELSKTIDSLIVDRDSRESEAATLRESSAVLQKEKNALSEQLSSVTGDNAKLSRMIEALAAKHEALEREIGNAGALLAAAQQEREVFSRDTSRKLSESGERERQLREMNDSLVAERRTLEDELKSSANEGLGLSQMVKTAIADRHAMKRELEIAYELLATARREQEAICQDTSRKLFESAHRESALGDTVRSLIVDRDAHKAAVEELVESRDRYEQVLRQSHERGASLERSLNAVRSELFAVYRSRSWRLNLLLRKITGRGDVRQNELAALASPDSPPRVDAVSVMTAPVVPRIPMPDEEASKSRILLVSYYCPTRAHAGGLRILDLYSLIRKRCPTVQLDLFTHHRPNIDWSLEDAHHIFDNVYLSPHENLSSANLARLRQSSRPYDVIDLQFHQSGYGLEGFRSIGQKIVYTPMESLAKVLFYDLRSLLGKGGQLRLTRIAASLRNAAEEIAHCRRADTVVCVSRAEAAFLRMVTAQRNVEGIDTGISTLEFAEGLEPGYSPLPAAQRPQKILYVAYFGSETNVEALRWFLDNVHPLIRAKVPGYVLSVVGRGDLTAFANDRHESIEFVGEVPAIAPHVSKSRVGIAPALSGSGFRGKVNQYAVMGVPSVVSSIAMKGLSYRHGRDIFVEDLPEDFANRCISLLVDTELNDQMGAAARRQCIDKYSWESKWPALRKIYGLEGQE